MAIYTGGAGNDTFVGTSAADEMYGNDGDDSLSGGAGDDLLVGGLGADAMTGGFGNDTFEVDDAGDTVVEASGGGTDTVRTTLASYTLGTHVENLVLTATGAARTATGNGNANVFTLANGAMTVNGGNGLDTVSYVAETGAVAVDLLTNVHGGMAADDSLTSIENVTGTAFADDLSGNSGANVLDGGDGADTLTGRAGSDTYVVDNAGDIVIEAAAEGTDEIRLYNFAVYTLPSNVEKLRQMTSGALSATGNAENNEIVGNAGADEMWGGDGHDTLVGQSGDDILHGGAGHDTLNGAAGADTMEGNDGNDAYVVDNAGDTVVELAAQGHDQVMAGIDYTLPAQVEDLSFSGSAGFTGAGNALDNIIVGAGGGDVLIGADGNDELRGQGGDDVLLGDNGADLIVGGGGVDVMSGGASGDQFRFAGFETSTGAGADRITDFTPGADVIDLSQIDADLGAANNQAFSFIGPAAFSSVAGELRFEFNGVDTVVQGDINGDGSADFEILLSGGMILNAADFIL